MDVTAVVQPLAGGVLIGLAISALLLFNGRIAGISGILAGTLRPTAPEWSWRMWFVGGLLAGDLLIYAVAPEAMVMGVQRSWPVLIGGGVLVGFGTRLGSGCTSGHGVCGIARMSWRSWVATAVFTFTGAVTVYVLEHALRGN